MTKMKLLPLLLLPLLLISCATQSVPVGSGLPKNHDQARVVLAKRILQMPNQIQLMSRHVSGRRDNATAYKNMVSTAGGWSAARSSYAKAPGGYVKLQPAMLYGMIALANQGYSYQVSELAGGGHSRNSRHYDGVAVDICYINGVKVNYRNPYYRSLMRAARKLGATEVYGPGDRGHSGHVHIAWPRPY